MTMSALYWVTAIICNTVRRLVNLRSDVIRSYDYFSAFRLDPNYIISDTAGSLCSYKRMIELCQKTACTIVPDANFLYENFVSIGPLLSTKIPATNLETKVRPVEKSIVFQRTAELEVRKAIKQFKNEKVPVRMELVARSSDAAHLLLTMRSRMHSRDA